MTSSTPKDDESVRELTAVGFNHSDTAVANTVDWHPSTLEISIMVTLALITFMIALDACIIATSLHVSKSALEVKVYMLRSRSQS